MNEEFIRHNEEFVANKSYEKFACDKRPAKKTAIVTCMDTRLVELLPAALGIRNGDVKMIKNAGGVIDNPFDSTMRSLLVGVYELGVENIMVIAHTDCGVQGMRGKEMLELMEQRGVTAETISVIERCGIRLEDWLSGFDVTEEAVRRSVELIRRHPLMPAGGVTVSGFVIDTRTGKLNPVE